MSSEALLRACLKRIDERDKDVCAWTTLDRDGAIAAAREVDGACRPDSGNLPPLLGIPIGVKDNIATAVFRPNTIRRSIADTNPEVTRL